MRGEERGRSVEAVRGEAERRKDEREVQICLFCNLRWSARFVILSLNCLIRGQGGQTAMFEVALYHCGKAAPPISTSYTAHAKLH